MNHFESRKIYDQIMMKLTSPKVIRDRAKGISSQANGNDASDEVKNDAQTGMQLASPFNFSSQFGWWVRVAGVAALALAAIGGWIIYVNGEIAGAIMYAAIAIAVIAALTLPYAYNMAMAVRRTANKFPSTIESKHVVDAHRFIGVFGEAAPRGRFLINTGAGVDAILAAWILIGVFSQLPVIAKLAAVVSLMLVFIASISALANAFAHMMRKIRGRNVVRTKENNIKRATGYDDEVAYLRSECGPLCGSDYRQNRWTDYAMAGLPLLGIVVLFILVVATRLLLPQTDESLSTPVLLAVSSLFCLIAITGAVLGAGAHLLPEVGEWQTAIAKRFPSEAAFTQWRKAIDQSIMRTANQKATALQAVCAEADKQSKKGNVVIPMPFNLGAATPRTPSSASPAAPGSSGKAYGTVNSSAVTAAPYPVKWAPIPTMTH